MAGKPKTRIKDIAKRVNLSPAAVSLALNNKAGVGDATRKLILAVAAEMGYCGPAVKNRIHEENGTICFLHITCHGHILNRDHDVFISDYISGLSQEALNQNYDLHTITFKSAAIQDILFFIQHSDANGFIILGTELIQDDIRKFKSIDDRPLVFLDACYPYLNFNFVDMNNTDIIYNAISYLLDRGHEKIGYINGSPLTPNFQLREQAFRTVMRELKKGLNEDWIIQIDALFEEGYRDFKDKLAGMKSLPTAFLCGNDILAAASMKALKETGYKIPEDVSFLGIDDLPLTRQLAPPLSSFQVSKAKLGTIAVQVLMARINNPDDTSSVKVLISGKLVERESVGIRNGSFD